MYISEPIDIDGLLDNQMQSKINWLNSASKEVSKNYANLMEKEKELKDTGNEGYEK